MDKDLKNNEDKKEKWHTKNMMRKIPYRKREDNRTDTQGKQYNVACIKFLLQQFHSLVEIMVPLQNGYSSHFLKRKKKKKKKKFFRLLGIG